MTVTAEVLRELHRILRQLTDLRSRLERGPKQMKVGEAAVQNLISEFEKAKEVVLRHKMATNEKELNLKERENRIADVQAKLNSASSNREYQAFLEQIAADEEANSVLSDEILELMDKTTELQEAASKAEENLAKGREELKAIEKRISGERESLENDLGRLISELAASETNLTGDFKREYDRLVKARGEEALAPLEGEVCGGCHQMVTPNMESELRMLKPILCKNCGCIIYMPES